MAGQMIVSSLLGLALHATDSPIKKRAVPSGVPSYVSEYAPVVYLYSGETYFPSDIGTQLDNTHPEVNFVNISSSATSYTLDNLSTLNSSVYLTTNTPEYDYPSFFNGVDPDSSGETENAVSATIIVNDFGNGTVIAFYWYFYAFNYGGTYLTYTVDDHVGDWEYNAVR
jgi:hypothetical protein